MKLILYNFNYNYRTKVMCREGGCGSCLVNAEIFDYVTQKSKFISINSVI